MIEFATLFLGLVSGVMPVEMVVGDEIAAIELRLDDVGVAQLSAPPWEVDCDFGPQLEPHRLEVVGFDAEGREVASARQWINLPRDPAEARIVLEGGVGGVGVVARLSWVSITGDEPLAVHIELDGRQLTWTDPRSIPLPPHNPDQLHFLRAEIDFRENVTSVVEVTFGGTYVDDVSSELTAVPVWLGEGGDLPPPAAMTGWFSKGGRPLEAVAVEEGPASVTVVLDASAARGVDRMAGKLRDRLTRNRGLAGMRTYAGSIRHLMSLRADQQLSFLATYTELRESDRYVFELFPHTRSFRRTDGGLFWLILNERPATAPPGRQRVADAVAVAGMASVARDRRRAVVLIVGPEPYDESVHAAESVRHYLESLRVPLYVWMQDGKAEAGGWGDAEPATTFSEMEKRVKRLSKTLRRQRIVWLRGVHLPQTIELDAAVEGVQLAR